MSGSVRFLFSSLVLIAALLTSQCSSHVAESLTLEELAVRSGYPKSSGSSGGSGDRRSSFTSTRGGGALAAWRVERLRFILERLLREQRLLAGLQAGGKDPDCEEHRNRRIKELEENLRKARNCRYNGLTWTAFEAKRIICVKRRELVPKVNRHAKECRSMSGFRKTSCERDHADLVKELAHVQEACEAIGRRELFKVPDCPAIAPLKEKLASQLADDCVRTTTGTDDGMTEEQLLFQIEKSKDRIVELLDGAPIPASSDPRFTNSPPFPEDI